ncbi:hypothetical protein [Methylomonas sp. MgM2]
MDSPFFHVDHPFAFPTWIVKVVLIGVLSSLMLFTKESFLHFRIKKKEAEYRNLIRVLGISEDEAEFATRAISQEYAPTDYRLPVAFATAICLCGFFSLFFGADLVSLSDDRDKPNMVLTGMFSEKGDMQRLRWQSQLVLAMGFTGAYLWSAQNIIRRVITGDLAPSTYYSAGLRMVFASLLSLMLSFFLEVFPEAEPKQKLLPVIAFLAGMLPDNALVYLKERIGMFSTRKTEASHELPLEMIEGINIFHKVRLGEVGIDNAQNLAEANVIELLLKTPFNPNQLIDWIAQAKLYLYIKSDIEKLRRVGIRTIFDVVGLCGDEKGIEKIAEETQISSACLKLLCERFRQDKGGVRLQQFYEQLGEALAFDKANPAKLADRQATERVSDGHEPTKIS